MRFFQRLFGKPQPPRQPAKGFGQVFVLEPILTPSGLLDFDGGDETPEFDDFNIPDLEPPKIADFASYPLINDADLEDIDFFGADGDPEFLTDSALDFDGSPESPSDVDASEPLKLDSDVDLTADAAPDSRELADESGEIEDFLPPPMVGDDTRVVFEQGIFTVGSSGQIGIDNLYDGGAYQGELAIFNIDGLDDFDFDNPEEFRAFLLEASDRALSDSTLGHVVISDLTEGAKFTGNLPEGNFNAGEYLGVKTFTMNPGDKFAVMIAPNGSVQRIHDILSAGESLPYDLQPLFSLGTANPNDVFHLAQFADVTGDGNTFGMEDLRTDGWTDRDYNDIVFQVRGATGKASLMDEVVNPDNDWRETDIGQALIEYAKPYLEPEVADLNPDAPVDSDVPLPEIPVDSDAPLPEIPVDSDLPLPETPRENQPLIGVIDTGFSGNNPDLDYSRIILGQDRIDNDANPLLNAGEGSEHGTHILGIIGATQDNGIGVDGINDTAPIWVGRAIGSGEWADSLVEFVDAAVESGQPNAVVNLSLDLTQVNPDGSVTTRYEFTPQERAAIEYARQHNVLMVVAAGNDGGVMSALGQSSQEFDNIITVGAAERVNEAVASSNAYDRTDYSSYGYGLDIMAPGGSVSIPELSLTGDGVGTMAGTSVATAKVTGAVSQVWAAHPGLSYRQVIEILKDTATDLKDTGWDVQSGAGLLNMGAAIHLAKAVQPEEYEVLPTLIPDTWSGEGQVTPMERAAADIKEGSFSAWIKSDSGVNLHFAPRLSDKSSIDYGSFGEELTFDAWTYGEAVPDLPVYNYQGGVLDAMWFRYWYGGQAYWIPSAYVVGYPPGNNPSLPPDGNVGYDGTWYHSTYIDTFRRNGGQSALGSPTNNVHSWADGYTQDFSRGSDGTGAIMKSNANDYSYWVGGDFWNKFQDAGGAGGYLGYPTSARYPTSNGWQQDFQGGSITIQNSTNPGLGGNPTDPSSGGNPTGFDVEKLIAAVPVPDNLQQYAEKSIPAILAECQASSITDLGQIAYILATVHHESQFGRFMEELWGPTPTQQGYENRVDLGNYLPGDGYRYRGRGYVQLTGRSNYQTWSQRLGLDLENDPDSATEPIIAAKILVQGMRDGTFTGVGLSNYINAADRDFYNARRIVNGLDMAQYIAGLAERYYNALSNTGNASAPSQRPSTTGYRNYSVKAGDYPSTIALREMGNASLWTKILKEDYTPLTEWDTTHLQEGQLLRLPFGSQIGNGKPVTSPSSSPAHEPVAVEQLPAGQADAQYFIDRPQFYTTENLFWRLNVPDSVGGNGGLIGNCTWYASGRLLQLGYSKDALRSMTGNAGTWGDNLSHDSVIINKPQPGDIAEWTTIGHVAVVERVNSDGTIVVSQSNHYAPDPQTYSFLHHSADTIPYPALNLSYPDRFIRVPKA